MAKKKNCAKKVVQSRSEEAAKSHQLEPNHQTKITSELKDNMATYLKEISNGANGHRDAVKKLVMMYEWAKNMMLTILPQLMAAVGSEEAKRLWTPKKFPTSTEDPETFYRRMMKQSRKAQDNHDLREQIQLLHEWIQYIELILQRDRDLSAVVTVNRYTQMKEGQRFGSGIPPVEPDDYLGEQRPSTSDERSVGIEDIVSRISRRKRIMKDVGTQTPHVETAEDYGIYFLPYINEKCIGKELDVMLIQVL